jgi:mersacidin/lichenicidin family type 2 lantibiotic
MSSQEIIRAWKDAEYRASLSEAARASLPAHPAAWLEVTDDALNPGMNRTSGLRVRSSLRSGRMHMSCTFPPNCTQSCGC